MKKLYLLCFFLLHLHFAHSQSIDSAIIHTLENAIENGTYPNIHSIMIAHNNKIIYEKYWSGKDRNRVTWDLSVTLHGIDSLHAIQSISKSVTSACVGIALQQGKINSIQEKIFDFFPEYKALDTGLKRAITIKDLLTMTAGFKWNEDDYTAPDNSEHLMGYSHDPVRYILALPMANTPGEIFTYNGGETQLLAAIIQKATGKPLDLFAKEYLFTPLRISNFIWTTTDGSDMPDAFSGLYVRSRDLMKFGLLYMNDGKWKSKQIVPAHWVKQSTTPFIIADDGSDPQFGKSEYGFQWWIFRDSIINKPILIAACVGNGGQRIFVDNANKIVVVFTGGNYRMPDKYLNPYIVLKNFIYPAVFKKD